MGPHSFKCGKTPHSLYPSKSKRRFNGAALFQVRKVSPTRFRFTPAVCFNGAALAECGMASMGPHSFKCGKLACALSFNGAALSAERADLDVEASMGPHSFKCGKRRLRLRRLSCVCFNGAALFQVRKEKWKLQWGRTLSSAERLKPVNEKRPCFNGAALFQVRKVNPRNSLKDSWFCGGLRALFVF